MRLAPGSVRLAVPPAALAVALAPFRWPASGALLGLSVAVLYFHRDPDRSVPDAGVVAPADGTVTVVREEGDRVRLGVYMRGRDVHVNRAPMAGVLDAVEHEPGANRLAFRKGSERNERLRFRFEEFTVEQIAGAFARRTNAYPTSGDEVARGQRIGHISFSSRCDLLFPPEYDLGDLAVERGDRLLAGETVLAPARSEGGARAAAGRVRSSVD